MSPSTAQKSSARPATMHEKGTRGFDGRPSFFSFDVAPDGPSTVEDGHVDGLLNSLEGAIDDLQGLQSRLSSAEARVLTALVGAAAAARGKAVVTSCVAFGGDQGQLASDAIAMAGVRFAHRVNEGCVAISATDDAMRKLAFLHPSARFAASVKATEEGEGHFAVPGQRPSVDNLERIRDGKKPAAGTEDPKTLLPKKAQDAARRVTAFYDQVPGFFGARAEEGKLVVSTDRAFPRDARIAIRGLAQPLGVACEFKAA